MSTYHQEDDIEPTLHSGEAPAAAIIREVNVSSSPSDEYKTFQPHAFHLNLPPHFHTQQSSADINCATSTNSSDKELPQNVDPSKSAPTKPLPGITRFAINKARQIVDLAFSIQINELMFEYNEIPLDTIDTLIELDEASDRNVDIREGTGKENDDVDMDGGIDEKDDDDEEEMDFETLGRPLTSTTTGRQKLLDVHRKCARLQSQITGLESLKCGGISQLEICQIVLHLLRLVSATVSYKKKQQQEQQQVAMTDTDNNPNLSNALDSDENDQSKEEICPSSSPLYSCYNKKATIHYDNVGRILRFPSKDDDVQFEQENDSFTPAQNNQQLDDELQHDFALPCPSREVLLLIVINLLSKKGPLRSVSNTSIYPEQEKDDEKKERRLLIIEWQPLLRMLLRTAPYLDERKTAKCPIQNSNSRYNTIVKRTVQLCRDARHYFEQGIRPASYITAMKGTDIAAAVQSKVDKTAIEIWDSVSSDVLYHSHTHACYRGTILLYLLQPSRCTTSFYLSVLPQWWVAWTNIDRCPEYDFLWLTMFCRARKYVSADAYDWSAVRKRLLTHCQYWLQVPIGGTSLDKSFPRVGSPRSRSCPPRLKVFVGSNSTYEEGIDFVAKVSKLLVVGLGTGKLVERGSSSITEGTKDLLSFLTFVTPYFNPSNLGSWTFALGALLHYLVYELCCRLGAVAAENSLKTTNPNLVRASREARPGSYSDPIPARELVYLIDAILPLCKQALYSKNGNVGRAGEAAMLYLVQIDPEHTAPIFIEMAIRALDVAAVNQSHQAPAALSALTRLIQPALRNDPVILLSRLPEILHLSLAGIDSNDQNKTIRTLVLYRTLSSWIPVGGSPDDWESIIVRSEETKNESDGTMRFGTSIYDEVRKTRQEHACREVINHLPQTSMLKRRDMVDQGRYDTDTHQLLLEETASAMSEWSLKFLDRIYSLLRASGEREKTGKTSSAVANRHSSNDVNQARNFSRVLKECLQQLFASMDDATHKLAVRSVTSFLREETLLSASKDASLLCLAAAGARVTPLGNDPCDVSPGLSSMLTVLVDDMNRNSVKTLCYRLRCLAGAVRYASLAVLKYKQVISEAIAFALASEDRHLFKTGCKLLRHTLSTLTESYVIPSDTRPRCYVHPGRNEVPVLGRSAQLQFDAVKWHVPTGDCINFAWSLLKIHVVDRLGNLSENIKLEGAQEGSRSRMLNVLDNNDVKRCLRIVRYSLRGAASVMLDNTSDIPSSNSNVATGDFVPYEEAMTVMIQSANEQTITGLQSLRSRISAFTVVLSAIVASETMYPDAIDGFDESDPYRRTLPAISSDPKICKETSDIALLLLTRRGASFRSQEALTICNAQKQLASDFVLSSQVDTISELLQSADFVEDSRIQLYKDGEDGGKSLPRRLLLSRVQLFHDSLQRHASFEVPRRLRRHDNRQLSTKTWLFSIKFTFSSMLENLESILTRSRISHPLDAYESLADGLYALCCHSNTDIRASALSVIDYALTRFGWMVAPRVPRLLAGLRLDDKGLNGKFGVPCCVDLVQATNQQGKRKRLAEAVKGICSILSLSRSSKVILQSEKLRHVFAETICNTDSLISLLPTEEMEKVVHYFQAVFSPFRSKVYYQPRVVDIDIQSHCDTLDFTLTVLSERRIDGEDLVEGNDSGGAHWRKRLLACWFLMTFADEDDLAGLLSARIWETCFRIIETESGQPLQRVALGLLGRLVSINETSTLGRSMLEEKMSSESFCKYFVEAIVFDHKEDTSIGGGHNAQWATGVEDIIRDAARNITPRTLFPFQRTSQALGSFKASHAQLVESVLRVMDISAASVVAKNLCQLCRELASALPSEDQRNQQITCAEILAGLCGSFLRKEGQPYTFGWEDTILPLLDEVVTKVPFALTTGFFDTLRYALQFCLPSSFFPLTQWIVDKISASLWQPSKDNTNDTSESNSTLAANHGSEGFTTQSKWLCLFTAIIIEMDASETMSFSSTYWYSRYLVSVHRVVDIHADTRDEYAISWSLISNRLLPLLLSAIGHPFDSCRDHISRCLFRICYCHRKTTRVNGSSRIISIPSVFEQAKHTTDSDPGSVVVARLAALLTNPSYSFTDRYNACSTTRRFISYCVHLGEAKSEYAEYIIPLLPLSFEVLKSTVEEEIASNPNDTTDDITAKRALEAEVIKGFRFTIAEVSVTAVISYGSQIDIGKVLEVVSCACKHETWQVRQAGIHFLRCFEGAHKFLFQSTQTATAMEIVADLLADDRREVSSAAMAALTGILAALTPSEVANMVEKYAAMATAAKMKRPKKASKLVPEPDSNHSDGLISEKEARRAQNQKTSVFFLCAAIMAQPYDTPPYVPVALAAISTHSFERNAPLGVRDAVKRCCAEYKRTHMSDNWELHRAAFTQEQMEALEDVVSSPHYYA